MLLKPWTYLWNYVEESLAITLDKYGINAFILLFISQCWEHDQRNFLKIKRILFSLTLKLPWQELGNRQGGRHDFAGGAVKHPDALSSNLVFLLSWKKMSHHVQCSGCAQASLYWALVDICKRNSYPFQGNWRVHPTMSSVWEVQKDFSENEVVFVFAFCVCVWSNNFKKASVLLE